MRFFSLLAIFAAILTVLLNSPAWAAGRTYPDIPGGHWASPAVDGLTSLNVFPGKGRFEGSKEVIRYDLFIATDKLLEKMGVYARKRIKPGNSPFSDVLPGTNMVKPMSRLASLGLVNGGPRRLARGMDRASRYEAVSFLAGLLPLLGIDAAAARAEGCARERTARQGRADIKDQTASKCAVFRDVPVGHWAGTAAVSLARTGISRWKEGGNFKGDSGVARYEMAHMLWKIKNLAGKTGSQTQETLSARVKPPGPNDRTPGCSPAAGTKLAKSQAKNPGVPGNRKVPRVSRSKFFSIVAECRDSGKSYVYGKWDCSRFVQHVYGKLGIELSRISKDQAMAGISVKIVDLQPSDLLFFDYTGKGEVTHSGIFLGPEGGNQFSFIHNSTRAGKVVTENLSRKEFLGNLLHIRRVVTLK